MGLLKLLRVLVFWGLMGFLGLLGSKGFLLGFQLKLLLRLQLRLRVLSAQGYVLIPIHCLHLEVTPHCPGRPEEADDDACCQQEHIDHPEVQLIQVDG